MYEKVQLVVFVKMSASKFSFFFLEIQTWPRHAQLQLHM